MASKPRQPRKSANRREYPRPQLVRENWTNLNGQWDFTTDPTAGWTTPKQVRFNKKIEVPFSPETPASGVEDTGFYKAVWYRRTFKAPKVVADERVILHFGAVDHQATVWINDQLAVTHEGGYTPFSADITDLLSGSAEQTVVVRAHDDPQDLSKPRGKQDWHLEPHSIWYYRTTGIWQTVWMEVVPPARVASLRMIPDSANWSIDFTIDIAGPLDHVAEVHVILSKPGIGQLAYDTYAVDSPRITRTIKLPDPGIDDARNDLYWFPWRPNLIEVQIDLLNGDGDIVDRITSYTALRSVSADGNRFVINNRPAILRLVLDQGYWAESGLTAPDDDALKRDVELVKELGFNGVRKHQKIEDPRFLYWADKLGLFVWEEMPSAYAFTPQTVERVTKEWVAAIERDISHPCIICWVPFNESWGVPDLVKVAAQRDFVRGVYHLTKSLDPTRPVICNDGWEMLKSDITAIHDYERNPNALLTRYARNPDAIESLFANERPGGRQLLIAGQKYDGEPIMLTEFGGIAFSQDVKHTWGYKRAATAAEFGKQYTALLTAVRSLPLFSGFCYTQFTDTYQEANGLLYMNRKPKLKMEQFKKATEE